MPSSTPVVSYTRIREYAERFDWVDPVTNRLQVGYNPPPNALDVVHHPFNVTFLTSEGVAYTATVICTKVFPTVHSRNLFFLTDGEQPAGSAIMKKIRKGETRCVSDLLIVEIDGVRFSSH